MRQRWTIALVGQTSLCLTIELATKRRPGPGVRFAGRRLAPRVRRAAVVAVALVRSGVGRQTNAIARSGPVGVALVAGSRAGLEGCRSLRYVGNDRQWLTRLLDSSDAC